MGILGKIFGSDKAIEGAVSGLTKGLDALVYTPEEKAQDAAVERKAAREVMIEWFRTSKGQNLARRVIAFAITGVWLFMYVAAWVFRMIAVSTDNIVMAAKIMTAANDTIASADQMGGAVMLILGFYFAAPHMGGIVDVAMKRFGGSNANSQPVREPDNREPESR